MKAGLKAHEIAGELKKHAPFTVVGALTGVFIMLAMQFAPVSSATSEKVFWTLHPLHVLLSALATAAMYRLNSSRHLLLTLVIGYAGSVGIATLSDSVIPFVGEWMLGLPNRGIRIGFIEKWRLVNPMAALGIAIAWFWPKTHVPHAGHVLLSTWASLFHMAMAFGEQVSPAKFVAVFVFLFRAVWLPCCTSDIVFPLLFAGKPPSKPPAESVAIRQLGP